VAPSRSNIIDICNTLSDTLCLWYSAAWRPAEKEGRPFATRFAGNMSDDGRAKSRDSLDVSGGQCCAEPFVFFALDLARPWRFQVLKQAGAPYRLAAGNR
jgi:hypothetical protein